MKFNFTYWFVSYSYSKGFGNCYFDLNAKIMSMKYCKSTISKYADVPEDEIVVLYFKQLTYEEFFILKGEE